MQVIRERLGNGAQLDLLAGEPAATGNSGALTLLLGGGRSCTVQIGSPALAIWAPLRGRLQVGSGDGGLVANTGEILVTECEPRLRATGRGCALWVALVGSRQAWRCALADMINFPTGDPLLLPARYVADRTFRRTALGLARAIATSDGAAEPATVAVLDAVLDLQASFDAFITRCPGRSHAQRRNVFLRLHRVRNYMEANCQRDLDIKALARMASYSPWHFIRAFCAAYGETPHAYLVNQRLQRAQQLLRTSPLAIAEIALASGFENRCAFSRLFRQRFGITAAALRRQRVVPPALAQDRA